MKHRESKRITHGADTAVLFIHGILGSPNHFRELIALEQLVPENWSVYNVLLDGHGGDVDAFSHSSMEKWRSQVRTAFDALARTHSRVILVAHSMGTLFAIQLAVEFPQKIPFLFLLGVPLRPHLRFGMMVDCLRMPFGKLPPESVLWKATSITTTRKLWKYLGWIPRYLELFREIGVTERLLPALSVPCTAYQSRKDELVSNFTLPILKRSGVLQVHSLEESTHFYYAPAEAERIYADFLCQINGKSHG